MNSGPVVGDLFQEHKSTFGKYKCRVIKR